jgi:K+-sensing histidine kinase KdpD
VVTDDATGDKWLMKAVTSDTAVHGVIAINIRQAAGLKQDDNTRNIQAVLEDVSLTLKRLDLGQAIGEAQARLQTELLRDAFHGSLSHELCSPLAAIRGSTNVLESMTGADRKRERELLHSILDETARLDGFIQNLLNASRVSAGGITPRPEWTDPEDVINAAIVRRARRLTSHRVDTDFAPDLSLIHVDSGLIEEACGQILENAAKYSPSGSTISIKILTEDGQVTFSIADEGSGITPDERELIGRRSFRSVRHRATVPGSGLGFWIASTFVRANGGHINIFSPGAGSGTTVSISFPAGQITSSELIDFDNE